MQRYPNNDRNVKLIEEITTGLIITTYIGRVNRGDSTPATSVPSRSILKQVETNDGAGNITTEFFLPENQAGQPSDLFQFARDDRATLTYQ